MKLLLISFFLFSLLSCLKTEVFPSADYDSLTGNWVGYNGSEKVSLFIKKNGTIEIEYAQERGYKFKVQKVKKDSNVIHSGSVYDAYFFYRDYKNTIVTDFSRIGINFYSNSDFDTILIYDNIFTDGDHLAMEYNNVYLTREHK